MATILRVRTLAGGKTMRELDVAVLCRDQLHVIECKTGRFQKDELENGVGQDEFNKLSTIKREIAGPFSTVALANPRLPDTHPARYFNDLKERAAKQEIMLWVGNAMREDIEIFLRHLTLK